MNTIYFNLLKYVHSPFLGEEVNVGILLCFPKQGRLEFRYPVRFKRLRHLYQSFSERQLLSYLTSFGKRVARANTELAGTLTPEHYTSFITRELVPTDATVLRFGNLTKAVAHPDDDPQQVADEYYELYFAETQPAPRAGQHKRDSFLISNFRRNLEAHDAGVFQLLRRNVEVQAAATAIRFDYAWQNGTENFIKPVSFDLADADEINRKAVYTHGWLHLLAPVATAENYRFDLLLAQPTDRKLFTAFDQAVNILDTTPAPKQIITEGRRLEEYAHDTAHYLRQHYQADPVGVYAAGEQSQSSFQILYSAGQYFYRLRAHNGEIIQSSEGYTTMSSCENGIRSVQANCQPHRFKSFFNAGQYGFNHVAANGEIIGHSGKYTTAKSRDNGIQVVLQEAPYARIENLS
ncbi:DUF3037 domain-containing protein [Hymenobacter sp.]|uniref:DUF3037 domain-containing protein n=1 Tax=Hymenobacter sp. TaxID=1898978 RepID=UPI002ED9EA2E